jgi:aminoglycoside phosphotransferase (APT) family kinase protein
LTGGKALDAQEVRRIVMERCGADSGPTDLTVEGPISSTSFSKVFVGSGGIFPAPVAIKVFFTQKTGAAVGEAARTYYDALSELHAATAGDAEFSVVEPFAIIEDYGIVITEWITGLTFAQWLVRLSPEDAVKGARKAGIWLARLHRATEVSRAPMDTEPALERLVPSMAANPSIARGKLVQRASKQLRLTACGLGVEDVAWCRSHGDFKPANLVVRDGRLFGIDLDLAFLAPTVHDAAHFLNHLQVLFLRLGGPAKVPALVVAFREGYAEGGRMALPPLPLAWERLRNAVHLLLWHRQWAYPPRRWAGGLLLCWLVRHLGQDLASLF